MELTSGELVDLDGETIKASVIRDLLVEADRLDPRGVRIRNARIDGQLDLCDVVAKRPLVLRDCVASEKLLFDRAQLSALDLTGLTAPAVSAPWLKLDHYLYLSNARLDGGQDWAVDLGEAHIGGHISMSGATLSTEGEYALHALKLRTGSQVYLTAVTAVGTLRFDGARIGGSLRCDGASFSAEHAAFLGTDIQVEDSILLHSGFRARSESYAAVRIRGARIGGQLVLREGRATGPIALDLKHARIGQEIFLSADYAEGAVDLDGLTYTGVPRDSDLGTWLDMLAHKTPRFASQPYLQLAAAHQAAGQERDVRRIRIAQQRDLLRRGQLTRWGRTWHRVTGATVGYGYRPAIALLWLVATLAVSVGVVLSSGAVRCAVVDQIGYALNAATPLVKTDVQQRCQVATTTGAGQFVVVTTWVLQLLAWAFATLFVAGFTGLVRKNA
ncbi:hypothetical protein Lesp02_81240 [Lentzea sp. NBRC 105346]|uniref:hypothetical protein n=1 Tax=Lentzea sp. NBRC 105346 TaxID=3032205 RepID=UPI0024A431B5|nr:hypothetical protein [Lentzea sp. NBRC 105346]GLZ35937.1 hypothetical protein Lesp02_81240 [Lentzea sp. NBRC 105346]